MELEHPYSEEEHPRAQSERRSRLAALYDALPAYGSAAFWHAMEEPDMHKGLPLEVLVRCVRTAIKHNDDAGRNRIIEIIFRRIQDSNERWATNVLKRFQANERNMLVSDLYADLCERIIRAFLNPTRSFWEESFQHCLLFERKHVYKALLMREGRWLKQPGKETERIPRMLVASLDRPVQRDDGELCMFDLEDERAQQELLAVEHAELSRLILHLPEKLKSVILLVFWDGRTEKDTARLLGISDRTVRNRLREAFTLLHRELEPERGGVYG